MIRSATLTKLVYPSNGISKRNVTFVMELSPVTGMKADELSVFDCMVADCSESVLKERLSSVVFSE